MTDAVALSGNDVAMHCVFMRAKANLPTRSKVGDVGGFPLPAHEAKPRRSPPACFIQYKEQHRSTTDLRGLSLVMSCNRPIRRSVVALSTVLALATIQSVAAQHPAPRPTTSDSSNTAEPSMQGMQGDSTSHAMGMGAQPAMGMDEPLGIPESRGGSGTSWLPDSSPVHAHHFLAGDWQLMFHYQVFGTYDKQFGNRGDQQVNSINWAMLMASHPFAGGRFQLRGMMSAEPWTVGSGGYPLLLQSGESKNGVPLHDHQHPHDLFMELSALYERPLSSNLGIQLYVAPVGEPALGPPAFPHRPSAASEPLAPLGHHWQDATHIAFGVITAGLFTREWKLEGSIFNGREPDEIRTNFDYKGRSLDSYAGRLSWNPNGTWSVSGSYGFLESPEGLRPDVSIHRVTASILNGRPFGSRGQWSSALVYGANKESGEPTLSNSLLVETTLDLDGTNMLFGRAEYARKSAYDLQLLAPTQGNFDVGAFSLGYARQIAALGDVRAAIGGTGSVNVVPEALRAAYGSRTPVGFDVYVRLFPKRISMEHKGGMSGMTDMKGAHNSP